MESSRLQSRTIARATEFAEMEFKARKKSTHWKCGEYEHSFKYEYLLLLFELARIVGTDFIVVCLMRGMRCDTGSDKRPKPGEDERLSSIVCVPSVLTHITFK